MIRKYTFLLCALLLLGLQAAHAQLTDDQILQYIAEGAASGKTERQIGNELLQRGVTVDQARQLINAYRVGKLPATLSGVTVNASAATTSPSTLRQASATEKEDLESQPEGGKKVRKGPDDADVTDPLYDEDGNKRIYGMDIFSSAHLSFEPNQNLATPEDYVLGPGDELVVSIWGASEETLKLGISPEGTVKITQVGPVVLSGLTIKEAQARLKSALSKTYSTLRSGASKISLSLGAVRTIQVNVLGEVVSPGTYRLSSFSTVFNALYRAGGVKDIGSLRAVRIMRGGELCATVDVYDYIFHGKAGADISLREGDVIMVPVYGTLVGVTGFVKRPMFYEMKEGESLSDLVAYAGGLADGAWPGEAHVERNNGHENQIHTVAESAWGAFSLRDGDLARVSGSRVDFFTNRVEVQGAVYRPGFFELGGDIATVRQLVEHAGGLLPEAFTARAQLLREKEDRTPEIRAVAIGAIMAGTAADILLRRGDVLVISDKREVESKGDFLIAGYVRNPGNYPYADNTTLEDLILLAGGLAEGASEARVEVARRIDDPSRTQASDTLAQVFSLFVKNGLLEDGAEGFVLKPNDVVSVRRSPTYVEQRNVSIFGEVTFPGQYTLTGKQECVSDLVRRAGGATPNGNVRGAVLIRKIDPYERNVKKAVSSLASRGVVGRDSLIVERMELGDVYTVGLELDKALAKPGSSYDMVLRDGDELIIPPAVTTVSIQGEVLYPNTVQFIEGKTVSYYISQAGGYTDHARRSKVYVVFMNGTVQVGRGVRLEPGAQIVVPARVERDKLSTSEWLAIGTSAASIGTMVATIFSLMKK